MHSNEAVASSKGCMPVLDIMERIKLLEVTSDRSILACGNPGRPASELMKSLRLMNIGWQSPLELSHHLKLSLFSRTSPGPEPPPEVEPVLENSPRPEPPPDSESTNLTDS